MAIYLSKLLNFQQEFTLEDIKIARDVIRTYDCGMSRIALRAPDQRCLVGRTLMKKPANDREYIRIK